MRPSLRQYDHVRGFHLAIVIKIWQASRKDAITFLNERRAVAPRHAIIEISVVLPRQEEVRRAVVLAGFENDREIFA